MTPHVADGVGGGDDPQARRHQGEEHAQRLDLEGEGEAGQHLQDLQPGPAAIHDEGQQLEHGAEEQSAGQ